MASELLCHREAAFIAFKRGKQLHWHYTHHYALNEWMRMETPLEFLRVSYNLHYNNQLRT